MDMFKKKIKSVNKIPENDNTSEVESKPVDMQPVIQEAVVSDRSPKFLPKNQNKVALIEVEEKLKSMRQKRLDRLSTFVAEQSKLSEERNKNADADEIEEAIKSIQIKPTFKTIVEEKVIQDIKVESVPNSPVLSRKDSKEKAKSSSTRNFINKLSCTVSQAVMSSNEDLTKEDENVEIKMPLAQEETLKVRPALKVNVSKKEENMKECNLLLSPVGKQRKGIYMYETEFLEIFDNRKQEPTTTFKSFGKMDDQEKAVKPPEEAQYKKPEIFSSVQKQKVTSVYENSVIVTKNEATKSDSNKQDFALRKSEKISKLPKIHLNGNRNSDENIFIPRSPMPSPRKLNQGERILKKLQRNWDSLNEIMENDSDVDGDEIEDMKKTFEEAKTLLEQYQKRIKKLELKSRDEENLERIKEVKEQLVDIDSAVKHFRGLRKDNAYVQLSNRLFSYHVEINRISSAKEEIKGEKQYVLEEIGKVVKAFNTKVSRNEVMLLQVLEEQVRFIGTNRLNITSV